MFGLEYFLVLVNQSVRYVGYTVYRLDGLYV